MALSDPKIDWLKNDDIRPYVFVRPDNQIKNPGNNELSWFKKKPPVLINPLKLSELEFGNQILNLEAKAFGPANMAMPRWVFFDCAIVPGFVAGFAMRTSAMPKELKEYSGIGEGHEWTPLSLFIIIPTMARDHEWVAHNLCTINSLLPKELQLYGLGFLSKAFGLWYANVKTLCGFTQWGNPSIKLHSYYGPFEILTAYTPMHSYAQTLTYRCELQPKHWGAFFSKTENPDFNNKFEDSGLKVNPKDEKSLIALHHRIENNEGPFYLNPHEVLIKPLDQPLSVYKTKK